MTSFHECSQKELFDLRQKLLKLQDFKCAICGENIMQNSLNQHVDHQHCFKQEQLGVQGAGLIRGVLCRNCNSLEGKIWNNMHRYQQVDPNNLVGSRIEWLESLVKYYKSNYQHQEQVLHPSEKRVPKLMKSGYNKILKCYKQDPSNYKKNGELKSFPKYTGKITQKMLQLIKKYNLDIGGLNVI